jgi:DUF4097 and DUF4098 domain-containing protein YvlB
MKALTLVAVLALGFPSARLPDFPAAVQDDWCRDNNGDRDRGWFCEVREMTISSNMDPIRVDAGPNGGIRVEGWDQNEIRIAVRVSAWARDDEAARVMVSEVEIRTDGGRISSDGPRTERRESWSASFRLMVPRSSNMDLETNNGGVSINGVTGRLEFNTTNGAIRLDDVHGDVRGRTTNGGLDIRLTGSEWQGRGLDVTTTNGGVDLTVPRVYNARLETGTVNGGMRIDFPITVQGRIGRNISTDLGNGGTLIRVRTTNGGVDIRHN